MEKKWCPTCKCKKKSSLFKNGYKTCNKCRERRKRWGRKNKDKERESHRKWVAKNREYDRKRKKEWAENNPIRIMGGQIRKKYGFESVEDAMEAIKARENGSCHICKTESRKLHIDHDHDSGEVRGIICHRCNTIVLPIVEPLYKNGELTSGKYFDYLDSPPGIPTKP